jgi:hypothetical protein
VETSSEKYPRTYHFPFSEGAVNDDRIQTEWSLLLQYEIVVTEKLDGENTCIKSNGVYARSHGGVNRNPWAKPIWEIWDRVGQSLQDLHLFGENLYAVHSITYQRLDSHFYLFAVRDNGLWLSWDEVEWYAQLLDLPTVPVLERGTFSATQLKAIIADQQSRGSHFGGESEGVVCRNVAAFSETEFSQHVLKYVRKNHVQTDEHWIRNWGRAPLWSEQPDFPATTGELDAH